LDGVGCGALPDAGKFGDAEANTLGNTAKAVGGMTLPHLQRWGLGNIIPIEGVAPAANPSACWGKAGEQSPAKDSTVGHWELMCYPSKKALPTYPEGFPWEIVSELAKRTGKKFIGNKAASGTEIIAELGEEHLKTGALILYTSADSVLQIAAHEELVPVEELYGICRIARELMQGENGVGRIIARPFIGLTGNFQRTARRHDFSLPPPRKTMLDILREKGIKTISIGKIYDLFTGNGIDEAYPTKSNQEGLDRILEQVSCQEGGFIFVNLVDFDMLWGHRNDAAAFYRGLQEFDYYLPKIADNLQAGDLIIITADHGVDPTTVSTDHSREYIPILAMIKGVTQGKSLGTRKSFADVGATVGEFFNCDAPCGESFLQQILLPLENHLVM